MPTPPENQLPTPHQDFAGRNNLDSPGKNSFRRRAALWQPVNTNLEEAVSTVSRYAQRLIDRLTGKAYSADELIPSAENIAAGLGYSAAAVDSIAWHSRFKAPATGSDGDALTAVTAIGTVTAWTGTGTLRTGSNGINGQNAISFNGSSNKFSATTGGLALQSTFYAAAIVKHSGVSGYQNYVSIGDNLASKRRSLVKTDLQYIGFVGYNSDVRPERTSGSMSNSTVYLVEMIRTANNETSIFLNGTLVGGDRILTFNNFASDALFIGSNQDPGEFFNGLMAEAFIKVTPPTPDEWRAIRSYAASTYGITVVGSSTTVLPITRWSSTPSVTASPVVADTVNTVVGEGDPIKTGGTLVSRIYNALLSVKGIFAAHSAGGVHQLSTDVSGENVVMIWNKNVGGYSAATFCHRDGLEMGAIGYAQGSEPWGATATEGSFFMEAYNPLTTGVYGTYRFVQTKTGPTVSALRYEIQAAGDHVWFDQVTYASRTAQMTLQNSTGNLILGVGGLTITGTGKTARITSMPTYANDAAADADSALLSGSFYLITGNRAVFRKP